MTGKKGKRTKGTTGNIAKGEALRRPLDRKISMRTKGAKGRIRAHRKVGAIRAGIEERKLLDRKVSKRTKGAKGRKRKSREGTTAKIE